MGRVTPKTELDKTNYKFKGAAEVISEQYARAEIPEHRLYMIEKVVRMRGQHGRFGIDHSELLNYELEQTNKVRDDHMNWLVYKNENQTKTVRVNSKGEIQPSEPKVSEVLFKRLKVNEEERYDDFSQRNLLAEIEGNDPSRRSKTSLGSRGSQAGKRMSYAEWLKGKDAENRLRRKLTLQAQNEVKETLLEVAKNERRKYENRVKKMDAWLM